MRPSFLGRSPVTSSREPPSTATASSPLVRITAALTLCLLVGASGIAVPSDAPAATDGRASERDQGREAPHVVFVIGEELYRTRTTLPRFAEDHLPDDLRRTVVRARPAGGNDFPGLDALRRADLLVLSVRRRALPEEQIAEIRDYLEAGGPLVALRTSSHAFDVRDETPPDGHAVWPEFDTEVLGARYQGHYDHEEETRVRIAPGATDHPVLRDTGLDGFRSTGELYRSRDLGPDTRTLLTGRVEVEGNEVEEPVAWTHRYRGGRIFYTSLGHPDDFEAAPFRRLLRRAIEWSLGTLAPAAGE